MESREHPRASGSRAWPAGFAAGVAALLAGLVVDWPLAAAGAAVAVACAVLWVRGIAAGRGLTAAPAAVEPERRNGRSRRAELARSAETYPRSVFLELSTLGLGGVIGAFVTLPAFGLMFLPPFLKQKVPPHDLGPVSDYPLNEFVVTTFTSDPAQGKVSRRTAFVRNNGLLEGAPSFTIISNLCAHLGCPVEPNGQTFANETASYRDVTLIPTKPSGFGCPCHGGQYDTEGNRIAGPPVRALSRYAYSIRDGHLFVEAPYAVAHVFGVGADAQIVKYPYSFPGEHVDGPEAWLYPLQPPH